MPESSAIEFARHLLCDLLRLFGRNGRPLLRRQFACRGDVAEIDRNGFVTITGRKKELIVSSNGKKIYPSRIEGLFKLEPLVNQVLLVGDKLPYMSALVTINPQAAEQVKGPLDAEMKRAIARINKHLASFEQIRKFKIIERDFSLEAGELTPTMKLRRGKVIENFKQEIASLYAGREDF